MRFVQKGAETIAKAYAFTLHSHNPFLLLKNWARQLLTTITKISLTSSIDTNVPTKDLLAVETKSSFALVVGTFEEQNVCKQLSSLF